MFLILRISIDQTKYMTKSSIDYLEKEDSMKLLFLTQNDSYNIFCTKMIEWFKQLFDKGLKMMEKYIKTLTNPNQWRLVYVMHGGFRNEIFFISRKITKQSWKQGEKTQISRRERGLLSHRTCASQKQGCISPVTLGKCDAYWFPVIDSAMG